MINIFSFLDVSILAIKYQLDLPGVCSAHDIYLNFLEVQTPRVLAIKYQLVCVCNCKFIYINITPNHMINIKMATGDKNVILVDPHWVDGIPHSKLVSEETIRRLPDTLSMRMISILLAILSQVF